MRLNLPNFCEDTGSHNFGESWYFWGLWSAVSRGYTHLLWIMRYAQRSSASLQYRCVSVTTCDICGNPRRSDDAEFCYTWSGISYPWEALSFATTPLTPLVLPVTLNRVQLSVILCREISPGTPARVLRSNAHYVGGSDGLHPSHDIPPRPYPPSPPHTIPFYPSENSCHPTSFLSHLTHPPHGSHPVRE